MQPPPDGHQPHEAISGSELRRDVSVWGSYMWGYAAVGADIYTALGIITLAALGLAPLAFLAAGIVFALVGLCYAELASAYPLAGGGQYFTLRGLGDLAGLVAGAALVLDYTIDISLFTVVAFGYFNYFLPWITFGHHITDFTTTIGPIHLAWLWLVESLVGIMVLIWLNVRGIKVSTNFNEIIGTIAIVAQTVIVLAGFVLVWKPELVSHEFLFDRPALSQFAFGSSLAIIAFVGLETISQVAQETRRPATIIPRTSIGLVISVLLFAMAFSVLAVGLVFTGGQAVRDPSSRRGRLRRRGTAPDDLRLLYAGPAGQERRDRCPRRSLCLRRHHRLPAGLHLALRVAPQGPVYAPALQDAPQHSDDLQGQPGLVPSAGPARVPGRAVLSDHGDPDPPVRAHHRSPVGHRCRRAVHGLPAETRAAHVQDTPPRLGDLNQEGPPGSGGIQVARGVRGCPQRASDANRRPPMRSRVLAVEGGVLLILGAEFIVIGHFLGAAIVVGLASLAAGCAWALWPLRR